MSRRRVVVTGMGMLSPLGTDVPSTWQGILAGRSGIGPIEHTDLSAYSTRFGGSVKGFEVEQYLSAKEARKLDLFIQYGLAAGFQAVRNAGLEVTDANRERIGVAMGSGIGGLTNIEERVKKIVAEQLGVKEEEVTLEKSFVDDLGADSLDTVELVMALEEEFETEIPDEEAEKITTVQAAVDYVKAHQA